MQMLLKVLLVNRIALGQAIERVCNVQHLLVKTSLSRYYALYAQAENENLC